MNEDENSMYICKGLGILLIHMLENETDNVELSFNIDKIEAKFKVELIELKELKEKKGE